MSLWENRSPGDYGWCWGIGALPMSLLTLVSAYNHFRMLTEFSSSNSNVSGVSCVEVLEVLAVPGQMVDDPR